MPAWPIPGAMLLASALCATLPAQAARIDDRYYLSGSAYKPAIQTTLQASIPGLPIDGTAINLEDDLGMGDSEWLPAVEIGMRLGTRWRIAGEYYRLSRSASFTLQRDIIWNDTTYDLGVDVSSSFATSVYRAAIGWRYVNYHLDIARPDWSGFVRYRYSGPALFSQSRLLIDAPRC